MILLFVKKYKIDIAWGFCIVFALGLISIIWYQFIAHPDHLKHPDHWNKQFAIHVVLSILIICLIVLWLFYRKIILSKFKPKLRSIIDFIPLVVFAFFVFCAICYENNCHYNGIYHEFFLDHIGGFFAILMGFATVVGTYLAIRTIFESKHTITNYPQLTKELIELIEEEDNVRILSYFILPGYWQISKNMKVSFRKTLKEHAKKIKIVCLEIKDAINISVSMAENMKQNKLANQLEDIVKYQIGCEIILTTSKTRRLFLEDEFLPHYYFFVGTKKAIVVSPIGLPKKLCDHPDILNSIKVFADWVTLALPPKEEELKNSKEIFEDLDEIFEDLGKTRKNFVETIKQVFENSPKNEVNRFKEVRTLGFATNDQGIIDYLSTEFDKIFNPYITVLAEPVSGGGVSGGGAYTRDDKVQIIATPKESYNFVNWTKKGKVVSTDANYTFTATEESVDLVANFNKKVKKS